MTESSAPTISPSIDLAKAASIPNFVDNPVEQLLKIMAENKPEDLRRKAEHPALDVVDIMLLQKIDWTKNDLLRPAIAQGQDRIFCRMATALAKFDTIYLNDAQKKTLFDDSWTAIQQNKTLNPKIRENFLEGLRRAIGLAQKLSLTSAYQALEVK